MTMKLTLTALALLAAAPALAQTSAPATPAPAAATAKFTLDTPVETIVADPAGKAALDAAIPQLSAHPMYDQFKSMSLSQLQPMSGGQLTDEQMAKAKVGLEAIK
jgi:hypothetical protein